MLVSDISEEVNIKHNEDLSHLLPLREPTFFILLSLSPGSKHGYAIMKDVDNMSRGKIRLSTGTLYEALARLLDQGLIERIEGQGQIEPSVPPNHHPGRARKEYRLSNAGQRLLALEVKRMEQLIEAAQLRLREVGQ